MRRFPPPTLTVGVGVVLVVCGRAAGLEQQPQAGVDGGPVVYSPGEDLFEGWVFQKIDVSLEFFTRYRKDELNRSSGPDQTDTELIFRESVGISTHSYIGHPNLVDLTMDASVGIEDNFIDSETQGIDNGHESDFIDRFDITALILGEGPAPTTVYARRDEALLDREFAGSIDNRTTEFGGSVRTFLETAPTTFRYFHREQTQKDQIGLVDDETVQDTFAVQSFWTPSDTQRLSVDYSLDFVDESRLGGVNTEYTRHDATIIHELDFGSEDQHNLRSTGRIFDQQGDFPQRTLRLSEILTLEHSDTLETKYFLTLEDREVRTQEQQLVRGSMQLRHRLFDSLVSTFRVGGSHTSLPDDDFTSDQAFAEANFDYTKRVPYGRLRAALVAAVDQLQDSERGTTIAFADQAHTFNDPFPVELERRNIVPSSIHVTDLSGFITYVEGLDYTVRVLTNSIELRRVLGGSIADGQTVLIDFDVGPEPESTTTTTIGSVSVRYTIEEGRLRGLSVYSDYRDVSQEIDSSSSLLVPNETRNLRVGAEYIRRPFSFKAEYETQDSTNSPFNAYRLEARYDQRMGWNSYISAAATHEHIEFTDDNNTLILTRLSGEWSHSFAENLDMRVELIYRNEEEDLSGDTQGFEQGLEVNWRKGQTTAYVTLRNAFLESDSEDRLSQTFSFGLRRLF